MLSVIRPIVALGISLLLIPVRRVKMSYIRNLLIKVRHKVVLIPPIARLVLIFMQVLNRKINIKSKKHMLTRTLPIMIPLILIVLVSGRSSIRTLSPLLIMVNISVDG